MAWRKIEFPTFMPPTGRRRLLADAGFNRMKFANPAQRPLPPAVSVPKGFQCPHLFVAMGPDRRHLLKAALLAPPLRGLRACPDDASPAAAAMQVSTNRSVRSFRRSWVLTWSRWHIDVCCWLRTTPNARRTSVTAVYLFGLSLAFLRAGLPRGDRIASGDHQ